MNMICPMCDQGVLREITFTGEYAFNGGRIVVSGLKGCFCDLCNSDPILSEQITENQVLIADAKRRELGLLQSNEIRAIRRELGLTQHQASDLFGGGTNSFSKYERGEVLQSAALDNLLRVAASIPAVMSQLKEHHKVENSASLYSVPIAPNAMKPSGRDVTIGFAKGIHFKRSTNSGWTKGLAA
jgi:HTH-type transcriptional regulator/antitoxin MqsA